ncbi:universal stress protein, partial [Pararhodobacter marinus]
MPFATVIAATDLTDRSAPVAARARSLARSRGAQVLLAHVRGDDTRKIAAADLEASLHEIAAEAGADGVRLLDGPVQTALADLARAEGAGLIVLGPHRERRV